MRAAVDPDATGVGRPDSPPSGVFAAVGRFSVRHRWAVVVAWLLATVGAVAFLPSLGSVIRNDNVAFLPASSPSIVAAHLAAPFLANGQQTGTLVAVRSDGPLTREDQVVFDRMEARIRRLPSVNGVHDVSVSADGQARTALLDFSAATAGGGHDGADAVAAVRRTFTTGQPSGLVVHLTGPLPELVDQQTAGGRTASHVQLLSGVFIVLLLLLAFRSTLAPFVTLAPAGLALALAGPLIAASTSLGVQISSLLQLLLTALVLGAGTDYGLFLIFRYREYLRLGMAPTEAIVAAVARVGESITFSAATVVAALLSLLLASFGLYRGVGPGLAIGIAVVLLIELTLFPALLAILGRAVFWPAVPRPGQRSAGRWGIVAARVSSRPASALVVGTVLLGGLGLCVTAYAPSGFNPGGAIAGSDSGTGLNVLESHFGQAAVAGTDVVLRFPRSVWTHPIVLDRGEDALRETGLFTSVTGALEPERRPPAAPLARDRPPPARSTTVAAGGRPLRWPGPLVLLRRVPSDGSVRERRRPDRPVPRLPASGRARDNCRFAGDPGDPLVGGSRGRPARRPAERRRRAGGGGGGRQRRLRRRHRQDRPRRAGGVGSAARPRPAQPDRADLPGAQRRAVLCGVPRSRGPGVRGDRRPVGGELHPSVLHVRVHHGVGRGLQHPGHEPHP